MKLFASPNHRRAFINHASKATGLVKLAIAVALGLRLLFGKALDRLQPFRLASRQLNGLVELHNPTEDVATYVDSFVTRTQCSWGSRLRVKLAVVGSGPGGSIVAHQNSDLADGVLIIEEGRPLESTIPHHSGQQMVHFFRNGGLDLIYSTSPIAFSEGMVVGGGSEINSGLYHRLPAKILHNWKGGLPEAVLENWEYSELEVGRLLQVRKQGPSTLGVFANSPIERIRAQLGWRGGVIERWRTYTEEGFEHHGMASTYLRECAERGVRLISGHRVERFQSGGRGVLLELSGPKCQHTVEAEELSVSAGTAGSPELLWRSGLARPSDFGFNFHAMSRVLATFDQEVNDLIDIDPHQTWPEDYSTKFGAAVATPGLIRYTFASQGFAAPQNFAQVGSYYASTPVSGRLGMFRFGKRLLPYFLPNEASRRRSFESNLQLRTELSRVGGTPLGSNMGSLSTVHIFGSMALGKSRIIDEYGFLEGSSRKIRIRDASVLPSAPVVNPQGPTMHLITALELSIK